jgi:hypothetical protein
MAHICNIVELSLKIKEIECFIIATLLHVGYSSFRHRMARKLMGLSSTPTTSAVKEICLDKFPSFCQHNFLIPPATRAPDDKSAAAADTTPSGTHRVPGKFVSQTKVMTEDIVGSRDRE